MSLLSFIGDNAAKIIGAVGGVIDDLDTSEEERNQAKLEVRKLLHAEHEQLEMTLRRELEAKERILVAELNQDDAFTKRARPSVVYAGLLIALTSAVAKLVGSGVDPASLVPQEFWWAWGGITGTWVVGRTAEKRGAQNKLVNLITGKRRSLLLEGE